MTGPSSLISKYFHIQRSHQLGGIIGQLDTAAQLASEQLAADFVALIHLSDGDDTPIPVACHHRQDLGVTSLNLLQTKWGGATEAQEIQKPQVVALNDDPPADQFAAANDLTHRLAIVRHGNDNDGPTAMVIAYWRRPPDEVKPEKVHLVKLLLELVARAMAMADRLRVVNDFSVRLAQTLSVLEVDSNNMSIRKTAASMIRLIRLLIPTCGACFLSEEFEGERFSIIEFADSGAESPGLVERLAEIAGTQFESSTVAPLAGETSTADLSAPLSEHCTAALGVDMTPDEDHRFVMAVWTQRPSGFAHNDLELLSILGLAAQTVLRSALHLRRLHKSKRILEESSARMADVEALAALTDMTTGIAHDFNNVMGGIVGRVQLMKMKLGDGPILTGLNKVESLAMEGAETVRRIQEFTRRTRNKNLQPVNLAAVVRDCLNPRPCSWRKLAETNDITVVCRQSLDEVFIKGDADDLTTLMDKLIENAVEHSPSGGRVELSLDADDRSVVLTVTDQGAGIPDEVRKKMFYPFFTTKADRGAGLGLAIAHGVAVSHGGKIELDDDSEGGASFKLSFDCIDGQGDDTDTPSGIGRSDRLRILVVDDDEQIREVLSDMLTIDGHSTTACADGYKALAAVDEHSFDLIITDLGMPGMSGLDLAAVVHQKYPELPIAMITGWGTQLDEEDVSLKGIKTVLPKPFHLKDVKAVVKELAAR
jgi:signal transduction histidine kinase